MIADRLRERTTEIRRNPQIAAIHVLLAALDATEYVLLAVHARCSRMPGLGDPADEFDELATAIVFAGRSLRAHLEQYREACPILRLAVVDPSNDDPDDDSDIGF